MAVLPLICYERYDRLRSIAGRFQTVVGDLATRGERLQSLLSWRDPRGAFLSDCSDCSVCYSVPGCGSSCWILCAETPKIPS
ncbi:hypothetical protein PS1_008896 [Malus domestica]